MSLNLIDYWTERPTSSRQLDLVVEPLPLSANFSNVSEMVSLRQV